MSAIEAFVLRTALEGMAMELDALDELTPARAVEKAHQIAARMRNALDEVLPQ